MIEPGTLISGIVAGFIIAALPGPICLLCLNRTLSEGKKMGLVLGLGVTTADTIYAGLAAFGLATITHILLLNSELLQIIGGTFLFLLGIRIITSRPQAMETLPTKKGYLAAYSSMFFLTISNPLTIFLFTGLVAALGIGDEGHSLYGPTLLVTGICFGSLLWWSLLSSSAGLFQKTISSGGITKINRITGCILCIFGVIAVLRAFV
ncbi:LysE family translocator [Methanospirillum stamsii]|uniref:Lysine transporter LysE n=1 Tax=Methanospirillum stamsii TaxID=1277351 RepID=A0A2V2NJP1_9EURY|nr:LysE family transporter [Methanospirillum stamsii]PWR75553.1 lysine transporter LysE [Methanospirillum stamsii]